MGMNTPSNKAIAIIVGTIGVAAMMSLFRKHSLQADNNDKGNENNKKTIAQPPVGSKFVTLPKAGITLRYNVTTDEKNQSKPLITLLMLHGFGGILELWDAITPFLVDNNKHDDNEFRFRVVSLDLVGSGYSDKPIIDKDVDFDYSYRAQGAVVLEFMVALDLSNVIVVGHSSGTVVGAASAVSSIVSTTTQNNIIGAVFIAAALLREKSHLFSNSWLRPIFSWMVGKMTQNRRGSIEKMLFPAHAQRVLTDEFVDMMVAPSLLPNYLEALLETVTVAEAPYIELFDQLLSFPNSSAANNSTAASSHKSKPFPMLFAWGQNDTYPPLPEKQKEIIREKVMEKHEEEERQKSRHGSSNDPVTMFELEECCHYPQLEQPEKLAEGIIEFVRTKISLPL